METQTRQTQERETGGHLPEGRHERHISLASVTPILDAFPAGLGIVDLAGRVIYANEQLQRALREPEAGEPVRSSIDRLLLPGLDDAANPMEVGGGAAAEATSVRSARVDLSAFGLGPGYLVLAGAVGKSPPTDADIQRRYGLTPTESRVARLLAEGRSNKGIAAVLGISPHTARHHTERVLSKLRITSRSRVNRKLQEL